MWFCHLRMLGHRLKRSMSRTGRAPTFHWPKPQLGSPQITASRMQQICVQIKQCWWVSARFWHVVRVRGISCILKNFSASVWGTVVRSDELPVCGDSSALRVAGQRLGQQGALPGQPPLVINSFIYYMHVCHANILLRYGKQRHSYLVRPSYWPKAILSDLATVLGSSPKSNLSPR